MSGEDNAQRPFDGSNERCQTRQGSPHFSALGRNGHERGRRNKRRTRKLSLFRVFLASAAMLWYALYFVDPSQFPALSVSAHSAHMATPHTCAKVAASQVKSHVGVTNAVDSDGQPHAACRVGIETVAEPVVEQSMEPEVEVGQEPVVARVDKDTSVVTDRAEHLPTTSEEIIAASDEAEDQHDAQNDDVPITDAQPDRNCTISSEQKDSSHASRWRDACEQRALGGVMQHSLLFFQALFVLLLAVPACKICLSWHRYRRFSGDAAR
jgi:hypothetical protein